MIAPSKLVAALALAALSFPAAAFVFLECDGARVKFRTDTVVMDIDTGSFPDGDPLRATLQSVVAGITQNPSKASILLRTGAPSILHVNEIFASSNPMVMDGARAITFRDFDCDAAEITSASVVFNSALTWAAGPAKSTQSIYGGSGQPFDAVAAHEFGHVFGLQHALDNYTVMFSVAHHHTNGANAAGYMGEDLTSGLVFLYGLASPRRQDLALSHWRFVSHPELGPMGHFRTVIYDHAPAEEVFWTEMLELVDFSAWQLNNGEPRFLVFNGQTIYPEFTYENLGADAHDVQVGYYLSSDDLISTADPRIGTRTFSLTPDRAFTHAAAVTLPSNLAEGADYALGAIIDFANLVSEPFNEANNATYTHIRIAPTRPVTLSFNPAFADSGSSSVGTVTLGGYPQPGGVTLSLFSDNPGVTVPATVHVPEGSRSATFTAMTPTVRSGSATVTAYRPGVAGFAQGTLNYAMQNPLALGGRLEWFADRRFMHFGDTFCARYPGNPVCNICVRLPDDPLCGVVRDIGVDGRYRFAGQGEKLPPDPFRH